MMTPPFLCSYFLGTFIGTVEFDSDRKNVTKIHFLNIGLYCFSESIGLSAFNGHFQK